MREIAVKTFDKLVHAVFVFAIIAVPIFYVYGKGENYFFSIYDIYKEVLIQSIAIIVLGLYSLRLLLSDEILFKKTKLATPITLYFLMLLLSFTQMENHYEGFIFLKRWMSYFMILFVFVNYSKSREQVYYYLNWMLFVGTCFAFYGLMQIWGWDFDFLVQNFVGNATDGNPNFAGQYICIIFPLAIWKMLGNVGKFRCYLYLLAAVITGIFLLLNRTKGAWVGTLFSMTACGIYLLVTLGSGALRFYVSEKEGGLFKKIFKFFGVFGAIFVIFSVITFIPPARESHPFIERFNSRIKFVINEFKEFKSATKLFRPQEKIPREEIHVGDTTMQRIIIWQNTLKLIKAHPFMGVGLGNFKLSFQPYRTKKEQWATGPDVFVRRTHNEYLQLAAELGPIGIFAFFFIQLTLYRMGHELLIRTRRFQDQCLIIGCVMAFIAIFVTATFGFALQNPNPSFTLWMLVAIFCSFHWTLWYGEELRFVEAKRVGFLSPIGKPLSGLVKKMPFETVKEEDDGDFHVSSRGKKILLPLLVAFFVFGFIGHYWIWKPATAFYNRQFGQALQRMGLHEKSGILFRKSLKDEPYAWETRFLLANEYATMNQFDKAIAEHLRSLDLNPYHAKGHYNLGNTYHKLGRNEEAKKHYELAVRYDSMLYQGFTNLGAMYFKDKQYEKSIQCYKDSLEINPNFFSAYYNISYALCGLGRIGEAIPYLKRAKELQPTNKKVLALEQKVGEIIQRAQQQQRVQVVPQKTTSPNNPTTATPQPAPSSLPSQQ